MIFLKFTSIIIITIMCGVGCGSRTVPSAKTSSEAIEIANLQSNTEKQVDYLVKQAEQFLDDDNYDEAINVANYVISHLDKDSQQAQEIMAQASIEMEQVTQQALEEARKQIKHLGL